MNIFQEGGGLSKDKPLGKIQLNPQKIRKLKPIDKNKIKLGYRKRNVFSKQKTKDEIFGSRKSSNKFQRVPRNKAFSQSPRPLPLGVDSTDCQSPMNPGYVSNLSD